MNEVDTSKALVIVNNINPYILETVNILSLQNNFSTRFRFQKKYAPTLLNNLKALADKEGTIVIRNREKTNFLPIRQFKIFEIERFGDVIFISVLLQNIVSFEDNNKELENQIEKINSMIQKAVAPYENKPNEDLLNLILLEDGQIYNHINLLNKSFGLNELERWGNLIGILAKKFDFINIDFFRIIDIKENNKTIKTIFNKKIKKHCYAVHSGKNYKMGIIQRTYTQLKGNSALPERRYFNFQSLEEDLNIIFNKILILGKYEIIDFKFKINNKPVKRDLNLYLDIVNEGKTYSTPQIEIPIKIKLSKRLIFMNVLSMLLFVGSLIAYIMSGKLYSLFGINNLLSIDKFEKLSIIGMIIFANLFGSFAKEISSKLKLS